MVRICILMAVVCWLMSLQAVARSMTVPHAALGGDSTRKAQLVDFSGFIKYDLFVDTRQTVNAREGLVSMYPENRLLDGKGNDIHGGVTVNMLAIHSRLGVGINGPDFLRARTSGLIEADFYGNANNQFSDLNGLRLFNAFVKFKWTSTQLLAGQYWHPMAVPEFFPSTVAFSAGAPFHPMSRNPQIRIQQSMGDLQLIGALISQRDFTSTGPDGPGSHYLRNAGMPNLHMQVQYKSDSAFVSGGAGVDYKRIIPARAAVNEAGEWLQTHQAVSSASAVGFVRLRRRHFDLTAQGVYAQNAYDLLMLGGYAERGDADPQTGKISYVNLTTASLWLDAQWKSGAFHFGGFCGYIKNRGAGKSVNGTFYSRSPDIDWVYRISPRIGYSVGSISMALECEYTSAAYGKVNGDGKGGVTTSDSVGNFRSLMSLKYAF